MAGRVLSNRQSDGEDVSVANYRAISTKDKFYFRKVSVTVHHKRVNPTDSASCSTTCSENHIIWHVNDKIFWFNIQSDL
jgi:hypothetical protein